MSRSKLLHEDRLFPALTSTRNLAKELYESVEHLPIVSPHGHTDPAWFARNEAFPNPTELLIKPDHYVFRMLYSQGVPLESLGIGDSEQAKSVDPLDAWRTFAKHYYLFRGTPSRTWMDYVFQEVFDLTVPLREETADDYYHAIDKQLKLPEFRPRALFERFNIEVIATTENPLDDLAEHKIIQQSGWQGKVITAFRPDNVLDPEFPTFTQDVQKLGDITGENTDQYNGYLQALMQRRAYFKAMGATSTDHGHPSAHTADLSESQASQLFQKALNQEVTAQEAETFRGHMLTQMAAMSIEDGLVMQLHPGCYRNHNSLLFERFGRDKGADLPLPTEYVHNLHPLLSRFGNDTRLQMILFTLDETTYSRELAPLAGHYPCLKLGPAWWFHDSPEGMKRFRMQTLETAGFYNTVGFNDDTRAFLSIPARHDVARRIDCAVLAELVADHRLSMPEAQEIIVDLSYRLAKQAYHL